jgi:hypothetical protein
LLLELAAIGERFVFGQGYDNLADIEPPELQRRAHTITVPLPDSIYQHTAKWSGSGTHAVFLCPAICDSQYYGQLYRRIKREFGDLPHMIFGRQVRPIEDSAVLPYLTDEELISLYRTAPVFVYPHAEPRHLHYSPLEAITIGTPTLYLRDSLLGKLTADMELPGSCGDIREMYVKASRLLHGDDDLSAAIRASQGRVLEIFAADRARKQWAAVLCDDTLTP